MGAILPKDETKAHVRYREPESMQTSLARARLFVSCESWPATEYGSLQPVFNDRNGSVRDQ